MPDVAVRPVLWTGITIAAVIAVVIMAVFALLHFSRVPPGGERLSAGDDAKLAAPGLSSAPQDELARYRQEKEAQRDSWGWIDRQGGIAHIPVATAMDLFVQRQKDGR
jgi:hypothetical protein